MSTFRNEVNDPAVPDESAIHGIAHGSSAIAVFGQGAAVGLRGDGATWHGVAGISTSTTGGAGVNGTGNVGVQGVGQTWIGVYGETQAPPDAGSSGVLGEGKDGGDGVKGHANGPGKAAVAGFHLSGTGPGIFGRGNPAGRFEGDVVVTGDLILPGADVAEQFDVAERVDDAVGIEPGTVVVLDDEGALAPCERTYDTTVAGVVSGAGDRVPALVLDRREAQGNGAAQRRTVAVVGKVWCRAEASPRPIRVGDLLTTSSVQGHAMAATDRESAFGAVLGKALTPLATGTGLVLTLVGLG
ncbi:hypothetical protein OHT76_00240 [Streptomyces sp. NBC_00287]|uniref:hypothetical protein n=1 Tax=Streptomyces sp. NBC_00287 TaxID=2975702 RepID=UPI002E2DEC9C|nr:hypothetical protein [Streptomyces sp. NBC_00287]